MTTANGAPAERATAPPLPPFAGAGTGLSLLRDRRIIMLDVPVTAYLALTGYVALGSVGIALAVAVSVLLVMFGPRIPAEAMLSVYRARALSPGQGSTLREIVSTVSARAGLSEPPALAIIPSLAIGAFSVGHGQRKAILVTEGLLRRHSLPEIAAIIAHEIAHIRAGELPLFALADAVTRAAQAMFTIGATLTLISGVLWLFAEPAFPWLPIALLLAAPLLSSQLQLAMPREHDLLADLDASGLIGDRGLVAKVAAATSPGCGSPLDDIRLPVPQRRVPLPSPLRAHIDGPARAARLLAARLPPDGDTPPLSLVDGPLISLAGVGPVEMRPRNRWPGVWF